MRTFLPAELNFHNQRSKKLNMMFQFTSLRHVPGMGGTQIYLGNLPFKAWLHLPLLFNVFRDVLNPFKNGKLPLDLPITHQIVFFLVETLHKSFIHVNRNSVFDAMQQFISSVRLPVMNLSKTVCWSFEMYYFYFSSLIGTPKSLQVEIVTGCIIQWRAVKKQYDHIGAIWWTLLL